jgi:hypothetical protein
MVMGTIEALEEAITYLADTHNLYLWRVNERLGGEHVKGWAFARRGLRNDFQADTISGAVTFNLEKIREDNRLAQKKTQESLETTMYTSTRVGELLSKIRTAE